MAQTETRTSSQIARSLISKGVPKNVKIEIHKGGIGFLSGDIHNYNNKLYINVGTEDFDPEKLSKLPIKQLKKTIVTKPSHVGRNCQWCGYVTLGLMFIVVQVVLFVIFTKVYLPSENVHFPYSQSSLPETPVGVVVGANAAEGPRMFERAAWVAQPPMCPPSPLPLPVKRVVVLHTGGEPCTTVPDCARKIRFVQQFHVESNSWCDIGFNFLIGGDGNVYEGRGWDFVGAHTKGYNNRSLGVAFVGTFIDKLPNPAQVEAFRKLMDVGVIVDKVDRNYTLQAHCQLTVTANPGWALAHELTSWQHFDRSLPIRCTKPQAVLEKEEL